MRLLILGGNGYLGSKLTHKLLSDNRIDSVICTVRKGSAINRLSDIQDSVQIIPSSADAISSLLKSEKVDTAINLICNYGRNGLLYDKVLEANIEFPLKAMNLAANYGVNRFITIGTGLPADLNMYSYSKKMFSEFGRFYAEKHGISFTNIRLEMFYGCDEPRDRFIPGTIEKMLLGKQINMTLGTQKRDIIAINDVIKAIEVILFASMPGYREISVGTGVAPSISELIDYIWELTGRKSEINKGAIQMRLNEPDCIADTSQLQQLCNWQPEIWKAGVENMVASIKKELESK